MNPIIDNIQKIVDAADNLLTDVKNLQEYKNYMQETADKVRDENRELREANTHLATELLEMKVRIKQYEDDLGEMQQQKEEEIANFGDWLFPLSLL